MTTKSKRKSEIAGLTALWEDDGTERAPARGILARATQTQDDQGAGPDVERVAASDLFAGAEADAVGKGGCPLWLGWVSPLVAFGSLWFFPLVLARSEIFEFIEGGTIRFVVTGVSVNSRR